MQQERPPERPAVGNSYRPMPCEAWNSVLEQFRVLDLHANMPHWKGGVGEVVDGKIVSSFATRL